LKKYRFEKRQGLGQVIGKKKLSNKYQLILKDRKS